jgi:hypothetical protein
VAARISVAVLSFSAGELHANNTISEKKGINFVFNCISVTGLYFSQFFFICISAFLPVSLITN